MVVAAQTIKIFGRNNCNFPIRAAFMNLKKYVRSNTGVNMENAMTKAKTYDDQSYDLARSFLADTPALNNENNRDRLAAHIQQTIEDWISYEEGLKCGNVS